MKKHLLLLSVLILYFQVGHAQTPVSGGIYSDTTWTLSGSPYIVTDNVVVFPGVTLTIEPGVIVKFENNVKLEIREARLLAIGTSNDSITFTSNIMPPVDGWDIKLNNDSASTFNYCNFSFSSAGGAINRQISKIDCNLVIKNSSFLNNPVGLNTNATNTSYTIIDSCTFKNNTQGASVYGYVTVDHCNISNNKLGITIGNGILQNSIIDSNGLADSTGGVGANISNGASVINCKVTNNDKGILKGGPDLGTITQNVIENNNYGLKLLGVADIQCNKICNNILFNLFYMVQSTNLTVDNNYWCTSDLDSIADKIYDGYDNILFGLVSFDPIDTTQCYLNSGVIEKPTNSSLLNIYPNPAADIITLNFNFTNTEDFEMSIFNIMGELVLSEIIKQNHQQINLNPSCS